MRLLCYHWLLLLGSLFGSLSASAATTIGGNETAAKTSQQNHAWQQAIHDFNHASVDDVINPYLQLLAQLNLQPQENWCRAEVRHLVDQALSLNPSSLIAHAMRYRCAAKRNNQTSKQHHGETLRGLIQLIVNNKQGDSLAGAIEVRELSEAALILQASGYNVLDNELIVKNGGIYYRYYVIDPLNAKAHSKYFSNLNFMKHRLKQPGISNELAIQQILRTYRQQFFDLSIKYEAHALIKQQLYGQAQTLLDTIDDHSMISNRLQGQIYLDTRQYQQLLALSKALSLDAKAGFTPAAMLLARFKLRQSDDKGNNENSEKSEKSESAAIQALLDRVDHFTTPGEGAYRLSLALLNEPQRLHKALQWLNRAVTLKHPKATLKRALLYQRGGDNERAFKLFQRARDYGSEEAAVQIAKIYHQGNAWLSADHQQEFAILLQLARQKNYHAISLLAERYEYGIDVPRDIRQTYNWYHWGWQAGFADAANQIAILYELGTMTDPAREDEQKQNHNQTHNLAYHWYRQASQQGSANGFFNLGRHHQFGIGRDIDLKQAAMFYLTAANNGSVIAYCHLATTLLEMDSHKGDARRKLRVRAKSLYELGARYDHKICPRQFGDFYKNELADHKSALHWYGIAAQAGDLSAIASQAYILGFGPVELVDLARSLKLHQVAAKAGDAMAQLNLGQMYQDGLGVNIDYQQANSWYYQAAAQGYRLAKFALGKNLLNGKGIKKNQSKGLQLIREAAEAGYQPALDYLQQFQPW